MHGHESTSTTRDSMAPIHSRIIATSSAATNIANSIPHTSPIRRHYAPSLPSTTNERNASTSLSYRTAGGNQLGRSIRGDRYLGPRIRVEFGKLWGTTANDGPAVVPQNPSLSSNQSPMSAKQEHFTFSSSTALQAPNIVHTKNGPSMPDKLPSHL